MVCGPDAGLALKFCRRSHFAIEAVYLQFRQNGKIRVHVR